MSVGELRPPPAEDPLVGKVISDRYRVIKKLGEGGMGAVYLVEHVFIEKKVALKVLAPELARRQDLAARFLQEARAASRIGQENVIDISDFGQTSDGLVFFAMEYLEGSDLGASIREAGALPWPRAKGIVLQICKALRAAHGSGIVHRDMKPENIFLIQKEGRADFVKLLDFGIAKVTGSLGEDAPRLTRTGMIFGTPEYMAPEQAEGKPADHRVDIYAVGCVIYHCLTGSTPFQADSFMAMLTKHLLEEPVPPSARRPDLGIPPDLDALVLKALAKDRDKRWQNMDELMAAVQACGPASSVTTSAIAAATTRSPAAAAPTASPGVPSPGSATQPMGSSATRMPVVRTAGRKAETHMMSREEPTDLIEDVRPRSATQSSSTKLVLIVVGIAVGVVGAAVWALTGRGGEGASVTRKETPAPNVVAPSTAAASAAPAAAAPASAPPSTASPSPTTTAAATAPPPSPGATEEEPGRKRANSRDKDRGQRGYRRVTVPDEAPVAAPPQPERKAPPTPVELKPFPQ